MGTMAVIPCTFYPLCSLFCFGMHATRTIPSFSEVNRDKNKIVHKHREGFKQPQWQPHGFTPYRSFKELPVEQDTLKKRAHHTFHPRMPIYKKYIKTYLFLY
ncbi:hypothetical protein BC940DRAFT_311718 [Gongronella butleri]|nr:hypothetical protein BC940DRAFT_311718 [Gongronella butleri]